MKQKIYCFVDENGQDTRGDVFIVSIVVSGNEKNLLLELCEKIEIDSGKGKFKWGKAEHVRRLTYLRRIFQDKLFKQSLRYSVFKNTKDYDNATIKGIANAVLFSKLKNYTASIYIDGLRKTKRQKYGSQLRKLGIYTKKVQGIANDENNSLTRLADSIAGFIRDVLDGDNEMEELFNKAIQEGWIVEV